MTPADFQTFLQTLMEVGGGQKQINMVFKKGVPSKNIALQEHFKYPKDFKII